MPDDTTAAMAHLRESCAIATGKVEPPLQVTCWSTGEWANCEGCGADIIVATDGRKEWATCLGCGHVTTFAP